MSVSSTRRQFLVSGPVLLGIPAFCKKRPQRTVVVMIDGFGIDYLERSDLPVLTRWRREGLFRQVQDTMPSVTNTNNASICCGVWPEVHGITGNSYFDERSGREEYMESASLLMAPTLFQRAKRYGVKSALLSSKKKTISLLSAGTDLRLTAEAPDPEWVKRLGPAPDIYSAEINHWLMIAALDLLKTRRDLGCLYIHTTDYPMHMWPPEAPQSKAHLSRLDQLLGEAEAAAPDAMFLLTADHGMNHKARCWDLDKVCAQRGVPIRIAIAVEKDQYPKHHRGYGGIAWIYCNTPRDIDRTVRELGTVPGVETVLTRTEAARQFRLMPSRIGDLVVLGDKNTVFGEMDSTSETLPSEYRSHGSLYERDVPLFIHHAEVSLSSGDFSSNRDLARWLYTP